MLSFSPVNGFLDSFHIHEGTYVTRWMNEVFFFFLFVTEYLQTFPKNFPTLYGKIIFHIVIKLFCTMLKNKNILLFEMLMVFFLIAVDYCIENALEVAAVSLMYARWWYWNIYTVLRENEIIFWKMVSI